MKKVLSLFLAFAMLATLCVVPVFADDYNGTVALENKPGSGIQVKVTADKGSGDYNVYFFDKDNTDITDNAYDVSSAEAFKDSVKSDQDTFKANMESMYAIEPIKVTVDETGVADVKGLAPSKTYYLIAYADSQADPAFAEAELDATGRVKTPFAVDTSAVTANGKVGVALTEINLTGKPSGGSGTYTYTVSSGTLPAGLTLKGGKISGTPTAAATAGAKVTVTISDGTDSKDVDVTITVAKGDQTLSGLSDQSVKVGKTVDLTVTGAKGAVSAESNATGKATVSVSGSKVTVEGVAEGEATITVKAAETADYNEGSKTFKVTVIPATAPTITVTNNTHTYDGTAKKATVKVNVEGTGDLAADKFTVTYGGAADQTDVNKDGYVIAVTVDGKTYNPTEKLVINPKELTVDFGTELEGKTLDQVTGTLSGIVNTDDVKIGTIAWTDKTGAPIGDPSTVTIAKGDSFGYTITLTGAKAGNYEIEAGTLALKSSGGIVIGGSTNYTVTYNAGSHGNFSSDAATTEKVAKNASPKNVPVVHPHDNYRFMGWSLDGKTVVDPTTQKITKNVTFTALYEVCDHMAYMVGRSDTQFAPNGNLTRAEAATILSRLTEGFDENGTYPAAPYSDLNGSAWYVKYINFAASKGIVNGRPDGSFDPDASITRAEFATMIANFAGLTPVNAASASTDVDGHWAAGYITALEQASIVTGYEDGTFRPNRTITRAEAATMVNGAIDRTPDTNLDLAENSYTNPFTDVNAGQWFFAQVMEATVNHVTAHFHTDK
jgi:hypothetical protein